LSLIGRYIFRQVLVSTTVVVAVLLLIFMSNQFAETLADAAADLLPRDAVFRVFGLQFVQYVSLLAPVGMLLGILLAMARLNRDSEMTALAACGVGPARLLGPMGFLGLLVACGVGWLALVEAPAAAREIETIRFDAQTEMELGAMTPGRFTAVDGGSLVIYAAGAEGDILKGVFIERESDGRVVVIVAEQGQRIMNPATGESLMRLRNGRQYIGVPGEAAFLVEEFGELGIPIRFELPERDDLVEARPTWTLIDASDPQSRAELAWRLSAPLSVLALTLLAVPLGRSSPREGKYARFGVGLLIYIIYFNMLSVGRVWVERGLVPTWLSLWWVHAALAVVALALLYAQSGSGGDKKPSGNGARLEPTD
jgi:lipopolysaccharide export system permease protein